MLNFLDETIYCRIGRRWTVFILFLVGAVALLAVMLIKLLCEYRCSFYIVQLTFVDIVVNCWRPFGTAI